jgi:hypothetical protein
MKSSTVKFWLRGGGGSNGRDYGWGKQVNKRALTLDSSEYGTESSTPSSCVLRVFVSVQYSLHRLAGHSVAGQKQAFSLADWTMQE